MSLFCARPSPFKNKQKQETIYLILATVSETAVGSLSTRHSSSVQWSTQSICKQNMLGYITRLLQCGFFFYLHHRNPWISIKHLGFFISNIFTCFSNLLATHIATQNISQDSNVEPVWYFRSRHKADSRSVCMWIWRGSLSTFRRTHRKHLERERKVIGPTIDPSHSSRPNHT